MTKKLIKAVVAEIKYEIDDKSLEEAIIVLKKLAKDHGKDATIDISEEHDYDGSTYTVINLFSERLETDEEYVKRIEVEKARAEHVRLHELNQLSILTKKYGK